MNHRHVFSAGDLRTAKAAIAAARASGIGDSHISLVAREDIELEVLPDDRIDSGADTMPAAVRGAVEGGSIGLVAGLIAFAVPAFGVTIIGAGLLAAIGTAVGSWSSALMGSAVPSEVRRRFEEEIERGRILVVLDGDKAALARAGAALEKLGAMSLPFDRLSMIS